MSASARIGWALAAIVAALLVPVATASAAVVGPQFHASPYGRVEVDETPAQATIRVVDRPGGVSYVAALDPAKTYRVRVRGRVERKGVVLRFRTDDRYVYDRAPNGLATLRVRDARELEVLVFRHYADDDERYRLQELTVEECACPGDADLRA